MLEGVLGPGGTASEASIPGYKLAGKTGTAQKPTGQRRLLRETKYVASFIGFAPAANPRLLVAVMVDEPQGEIYGGLVAAPAFQGSPGSRCRTCASPRTIRARLRGRHRAMPAVSWRTQGPPYTRARHEAHAR